MKKFIIIAIVVLNLIVGAYWVIAHLMPDKLYQTVAPSVDAFADELYSRFNNKEYAYIFANMTTREFQKKAGYENFNNLLIEVCEGVGNYKEREMYSWRIRHEGGETYFYIEYDVTYERGTTAENFLLKKVNDSWLIALYEFQ